MVGSRDGALGLSKSCFAAGKHAGAWVSLTASGEKHWTPARQSIDGATFVKAVRCYAVAVLSFAQAMRDFVTAMRIGVAAKYIKKREWMLETRD